MSTPLHFAAGDWVTATIDNSRCGNKPQYHRYTVTGPVYQMPGWPDVLMVGQDVVATHGNKITGRTVRVLEKATVLA